MEPDRRKFLLWNIIGTPPPVLQGYVEKFSWGQSYDNSYPAASAFGSQYYAMAFTNPSAYTLRRVTLVLAATNVVAAAYTWTLEVREYLVTNDPDDSVLANGSTTFTDLPTPDPAEFSIDLDPGPSLTNREYCLVIHRGGASHGSNYLEWYYQNIAGNYAQRDIDGQGTWTDMNPSVQLTAKLYAYYE